LGTEPAPLEYFTSKPWYPWLIVGLVWIGAFIGQLDATIVQLALPTLGKTFAASLEAVSWVSLAYLVAFASFLPIFGRLCEMFGRKSLYLIGYVLFVAASTLCGLASDLTWLVVFRVVQGIGGSLLGANSISILVKATDQERRGRALGFFAAAQAIGMSAGPAVGGLMLGTLGWHWVFWISVPFGLAAAVIGWLVLPRTEGRDRDKVFDWHGALLLAPALTLLVLALNQVAVWGPTSAAMIACSGSSAVLLWLLVRQERACAAPLVDLRLFRRSARRARDCRAVWRCAQRSDGRAHAQRRGHGAVRRRPAHPRGHRGRPGRQPAGRHGRLRPVRGRAGSVYRTQQPRHDQGRARIAFRRGGLHAEPDARARHQPRGCKRGLDAVMASCQRDRFPR